MAVREAYAQGAVGDDFGEGKVRGVDIEVAFYDLEVGGDGAEPFVGFFGGDVAEAENLANFAGGEEFFKLWDALGRFGDAVGTWWSVLGGGNVYGARVGTRA